MIDCERCDAVLWCCHGRCTKGEIMSFRVLRM